MARIIASTCSCLCLGATRVSAANVMTGLRLSASRLTACLLSMDRYCSLVSNDRMLLAAITFILRSYICVLNRRPLLLRLFLLMASRLTLAAYTRDNIG